MCKDHRTLYTVCSHYRHQQKCNKLTIQAKNRCSRRFADLEIVLGWCPACYDFLANAHKRGDHEHKIDPKDRLVIENYWAFKSWFFADRIMDIEDMPLDIIASEEPVAYRMTNRFFNPNTEPDQFPNPVLLMDPDQGVYIAYPIQQMPLEPDGTINFEKTAMCFMCRKFAPNQVYCKYVNKKFRSTHSLHVHVLINRAHRGTLTRYAKRHVFRKLEPSATGRRKGLDKPTRGIPKGNRSDGLAVEGLDGEAMPFVKPFFSYFAQKVQRVGDVDSFGEPFAQSEYQDEGEDTAASPPLRPYDSADDAEPPVTRMEIEDTMYELDSFCREHGRNWISSCEKCRMSRVAYWLIESTIFRAGDPNIPASPPPEDDEEYQHPTPEHWDVVDQHVEDYQETKRRIQRHRQDQEQLEQQIQQQLRHQRQLQAEQHHQEQRQQRLRVQLQQRQPVQRRRSLRSPEREMLARWGRNR